MDDAKEIVEELIDAVIEKKQEPLTGPLYEEPEVKAKEDKPKPKKKKELRGRPKGSSDNKPTKIKLKPTPKSAVDAFKQDFKGLTMIAIYGVDEFTENLIKSLWTDPNINFAVTDPIPQISANLTRSIGSLPYSIYRYSQYHHNGFIEQGKYPVVIVADKYWDTVTSLPNPNKVVFTCLSHWGK